MLKPLLLLPGPAARLLLSLTPIGCGRPPAKEGLKAIHYLRIGGDWGCLVEAALPTTGFNKGCRAFSTRPPATTGYPGSFHCTHSLITSLHFHCEVHCEVHCFHSFHSLHMQRPSPPAPSKTLNPNFLPAQRNRQVPGAVIKPACHCQRHAQAHHPMLLLQPQLLLTGPALLLLPATAGGPAGAVLL